MPKTKRSHQDNCKRVCAVCWWQCLRTAHPREVLLIQEYVIPNYTTANAPFPSGLCQTHRLDIHNWPTQGLSSSIRRVSSGDNKELQRKTLGKPTSVALDVQEQTKRIFSIKLTIGMKVQLHLSGRQFFGVLKYIRKAFGKHSIEVGLKFALRHQKSMFADLVTIRRVEIESLGGVKRRTFYHMLSWRLCVRSPGCYATWHDFGPLPGQIWCWLYSLS